MERLTQCILTGMTTLFLGGVVAKTHDYNSILTKALEALKASPVHGGLDADLANIAKDARRAEEILLNERKES